MDRRPTMESLPWTKFSGCLYFIKWSRLEDGFVISDRLVKQDILTSITMEEFVADVVDTKLGPEELTRDIPNVREEYCKTLIKMVSFLSELK